MNPYERATYLLFYLPPLGSAFLFRIFAWVVAFTYRWVPYFQRRQIIREALGSSLNIKSRLSGWSTHDIRSRPISMRFHKVWRHPDCEVMKWYNSLSPMSTTFRSIQHRRSINKPFYHEFLQITLGDGHICIVERMGEGKDADAVKWIGCTSHDIIQHFSPDRYNAWLHEPKRVPSEVITELTFPRTFDLMDVLAICYAMKQHARAQNYTLQRFNCYFLCCTIICILARRVVSWENQISPEAWGGILDEIRADLRCYDPSNFLNKTRPGSENPPKSHVINPSSWNEWLLSFLRDPEDAEIALEASSNPTPNANAYVYDVRKYLAVGICSLLNPTNPHPEEFLLTELMSRLNGDVYLKLKTELSRCLWQERLEGAVAKSISCYVLQSTRSIKDGTAQGSKQLSLLLGGMDEVAFPREQLDFSLIQRDAQKSFFRGFVKICYHHINMMRGIYSIRAFEGQYPLWKQFGATIVGIVGATLTYPAVIVLPYISMSPKAYGALRDDLLILDMCKSFQVNPRAMIWAFPLGVLIPQFKHDALRVPEDDPNWGQEMFEWNMHLSYGWSDEVGLVLERFIRPDQRNIPAALALINSSLPGFIWEGCLLGCVLRKMGECVRREIERDQETIEVRSGNVDAERGPTLCTVQEVQQRLLERIKLHAKRVNQFQLAEEFVVEHGMERAMSDIWASLPDDFGRTAEAHP